MSYLTCTDNSTARPGTTGMMRSVIELFQSKEHGKTARTIAITMCVFGAITAISAAATVQRWIDTRKPLRNRKANRQRSPLHRLRSIARLHNGTHA